MGNEKSLKEEHFGHSKDLLTRLDDSKPLANTTEIANAIVQANAISNARQ